MNYVRNAFSDCLQVERKSIYIENARLEELEIMVITPHFDSVCLERIKNRLGWVFHRNDSAELYIAHAIRSSAAGVTTARVCACVRAARPSSANVISQEHAARVCAEKKVRDFRRGNLEPCRSSSGDRVKVFRGLRKARA